MAILEQLKPNVNVSGIIPNQTVTVVSVNWYSKDALELIYKRTDGQTGSQILYRADESDLEISQAGRTWAFTADGHTFRQVAEAYRIRLAHLFDPVLAVHTSLIEPLPHQITAVYSEMLTRQPLRFLLADDPGAGKTIMAGLLIKELVVRGDVQRCLICVPGGLAPQWQDELWFKFQLHFEIITRDTIESSVSGNPFAEKERIIIRLDQVARDEALQEKLRRTEWDLVIVDEAHKMSAHFWGNKLEETKRYKLGKLLGSISRHFLLMTATPHNGKEDDFQLFLALLDPDRFAGRFREGVHQVDVSDIMRRMVKEELYTFEQRKLFPERRANTVDYELSPAEDDLYQEVTEYVRTEFNRADNLDDQRKGTVGFALTILQRRLASSPAAIYHSLKRRRERLEARLAELENLRNNPLPSPPPPGEGATSVPPPSGGRLGGGPTSSEGDAKRGWGPYFDDETLADLDDALAEEIEAIEEEVMDSATAALTMAELQAEIDTLTRLEAMAFKLRQSGKDRKWEELATIIQDDERMVDGNGQRRKLVIFTEHRDTLTYLWQRIATLFGRDDILVTIHGSVPRQQRRAVEDKFRNDPDVYFLLATDAAGEGINLQRAHLMINYDLPWNPNRLEQRFGRIHRIGQTEVCHLWNLVAGQTREGQVYQRLLRKLETESKALEGKVFDVLGALFEQTPLRKLLIEAIRYGDRPEVRAQLEERVDHAVDQERVRDLLEQRSLVTETMDIRQVMRVREDMERYAARRLQPHYIKAFFVAAFEKLGGSLREREPGRYRISYVPAPIRHRARELGTTVPVLEKYDRVCFDKELVSPAGQPLADFICPGHPLLDTVIDLILDRQADLLRAGAVLVDETDPGDTPRVLFFLQQAIQDARARHSGEPFGSLTTGRRAISREVHFVEIDEAGQVRAGGYAPYLDYRPATKEEAEQVWGIPAQQPPPQPSPSWGGSDSSPQRATPSQPSPSWGGSDSSPQRATPSQPSPGRGESDSSPQRGEAGRGEADSIWVPTPVPRHLLNAARRLRIEMTDAEQMLWQCLRRKQLGGFRFRKQHPIERFVLDFYCSAVRLAVELDGSQHNTPEGIARDKERTTILNQHGIEVIRFLNNEVATNLEGVLQRIYEVLQKRQAFFQQQPSAQQPPAQPSPSWGGSDSSPQRATPPQPSPARGGSDSSPQRGEVGRGVDTHQKEAGRGATWLNGKALEQQVVAYAIEKLLPQHLNRVKQRREELIDKTLAAVHERLTKEINYWDGRAAELRRQERDGKVNVRLNAELAQRRADELVARLERRKEELAQERQISATPPVVIGGALVIPLGLLLGEATPPDLRQRRITEAIAMQAVMQAETALGHDPRDVSRDNLGYDIESREPATGHLRFIEVKGVKAGSETVTVTHNEIMCGFNTPEQFILTIVEVEEDGQARAPRYIRQPFDRQPDSAAASVNFKLSDLLARSEAPG